MANVTDFSYEELARPFKSLTELTLSNFETIAKLNTDLSIKYANIYVENVLSALKVTDQEAAKDYAEKQPKLLKEVVENLAADSKAYAELGQKYTADLQKVISSEVTKASKKAA